MSDDEIRTAWSVSENLAAYRNGHRLPLKSDAGKFLIACLMSVSATSWFPDKFVGHHLLFDGQGGGQACGFTHGDGISGDSITGVSDKIAADAASCHEQTVDISSHQCRVRDVVGFHAAGLEVTIDFFVARIVESMHINGKGCLANGLFVTQATGEV